MVTCMDHFNQGQGGEFLSLVAQTDIAVDVKSGLVEKIFSPI